MDKRKIISEDIFLDLIKCVISGESSIVETRRSNYDGKQEFDFVLKKKPRKEWGFYQLESWQIQ